MKCKLTLGSHCSGSISENSVDSHLFHLFASKKTRRMEIYLVIWEDGAQVYPLSKECMINLRISVCWSVLNLQNWFENGSGSLARVKNSSTLIHKYAQVLKSISSKKLKSKNVPMSQLCWTVLGTVRTDISFGNLENMISSLTAISPFMEQAKMLGMI